MSTHSSPARNEAFLQQLNFSIKNKLGDSGFRVSNLSQSLCMSRTNLHRKLKLNVGMSATEYIRLVRLRRAAELLVEHPEWNICQVAFEVGFSSQSYFTFRFKEVFGRCPVAWRKRTRKSGQNLHRLKQV